MSKREREREIKPSPRPPKADKTLGSERRSRGKKWKNGKRDDTAKTMIKGQYRSFAPG